MSNLSILIYLYSNDFKNNIYEINTVMFNEISRLNYDLLEKVKQEGSIHQVIPFADVPQSLGTRIGPRDNLLNIYLLQINS